MGQREHQPPPAPSAGTHRERSYYERLSVPLRWWALATMFLVSVLLAFLVAVPASVAFAVTAGLALLVAAVFLGYGSAVIEVADGRLRAGSAHIEVDFLADPVALSPEDTRATLGVRADARAFLVVRPYLRRSVKVTLRDPADPTPYWLINTRRPDSLAAAIRAEIKQN
ncbi:MAG: DUF3093 domain-containing protein [Nocardioidaceae bacterium]|nr:MAG: DUF3093 domain-containing protein [Nocardioidaceae bacterium]